MNTANTGFVYDDKFLNHLLEPGHPESPGRLNAILKRMKDSGLDHESTRLSKMK